MIKLPCVLHLLFENLVNHGSIFIASCLFTRFFDFMVHDGREPTRARSIFVRFEAIFCLIISSMMIISFELGGFVERSISDSHSPFPLGFDKYFQTNISPTCFPYSLRHSLFLFHSPPVNPPLIDNRGLWKFESSFCEMPGDESERRKIKGKSVKNKLILVYYNELGVLH